MQNARHRRGVEPGLGSDATRGTSPPPDGASSRVARSGFVPESLQTRTLAHVLHVLPDLSHPQEDPAHADQPKRLVLAKDVEQQHHPGLAGAIDGGVHEGVVPEKSFTFLQVVALPINRQFAGTAPLSKILHIQRQVISPHSFERAFMGP